MATRLAERLALRRFVNVVESAGVAVPIMVGWLKPVIVLPTSVISGFTPEQVEALIVHELAHIRRNDYLVNLLQAAVETVLFYHPAVWWVSGRIRAEREHCCDDLAVTVCDRLVYARTLFGSGGAGDAEASRWRRRAGRSSIAFDEFSADRPRSPRLAPAGCRCSSFWPSWRPMLPATLKSADRAVTPVQTSQIPPVQPKPDAAPIVVTEEVRQVPVQPEVSPKQGTVTTSFVVVNKQRTDQQAELQRLEEQLKRLAEQQHETMTKEFELAIAANESQSKAQIDELIAKLKALQQDYERAKRHGRRRRRI